MKTKISSMNQKLPLQSLQNALAHIDDANKPKQARPSGVIDLSVLAKQKLKLKIYKEEKHHTPHVHVEYGSDTHKASVAIDTGEIFAGTLDRKYAKAVKSWVIANKETLKNIWNALRNSESTKDFEQQLDGSSFSI
jgi:hypothetical protein